MSRWQDLHDEVLLHIFGFLDFRDVALSASPVCRHWYTVSLDEHLWKRLVVSKLKLNARRGRLTLSPGQKSWKDEYRRLHYLTPVGTHSEVLEGKHYARVTHVAYSTDGTMLASCAQEKTNPYIPLQIRAFSGRLFPIIRNYCYSMVKALNGQGRE